MWIRETSGPIYRLKVTLRGTKPPIWRRFLVPGGITLKRLHDALQAVMGWTDSHLHQFEAKGVRYGVSDRELGLERVSESKTTLDKVLRRPKDRLVYEYDFGDRWEHDVILEAILPPRNDGRMYRETLEWVGAPFDPERFELGEANLDIHGGWARRSSDA